MDPASSCSSSSATLARLVSSSDARVRLAQEKAATYASNMGVEDIGRAEQVNQVLKHMDTEKKAITDSLTSLYKQYRTYLTQSATKPPTLTDDAITTLRIHLTDITTLVQQLSTYVSQQSHILSLFDVRQATLTVNALRDKIDEAYDTVLPKKPFQFRRRVCKSTDPKIPSPALVPAHPVITVPVVTPDPPQARTSELSITNKENTTLVLSNSRHADVFIAYCKNTIIHLPDVSGAVRIHDVSNCSIYLGPISGSAHIEHVVSSTITLSSRQLRIHTTTDTSFYVHVQSGPIIEHTQGVGFAPYHYVYPEYSQHMHDAGLLGENQWEHVEDFNWLRVQHSPNWHEIPIDQRAAAVTPPPTDPNK